jgi:sulfatase maturation enzyme AslB (radical SAM superfamily)
MLDFIFIYLNTPFGLGSLIMNKMAKFQNKINFILIYFKKAINYSEYILKNQGFWGLVNGLKVISSIFYPTIGLFSSPLDVQVEITTKCNLSCKTCTHKSLKDKKDMTFSEFKQIIDQFPNAVHVILQGIGEPLMNREIYRMISYAKSKNIKPMIITHGGLLTKENLDQLIKSGLHGLTISIDGYGINYEKIFSAIEAVEGAHYRG